MEKEFYKFIYQQQKETETVPPNEEIANWVNDLICLLFPEKSDINVLLRRVWNYGLGSKIRTHRPLNAPVDAMRNGNIR
jgi:hypothetical protein